MPFPSIPQLPEYEDQRQHYEHLRTTHADVQREVDRLTKLVRSLEADDVSKLADALRRGDHDVSQDDLLKARDDLATATRRRDGLRLAVNRERAALVAGCKDNRPKWDATLAAEHDQALDAYRSALAELCTTQRAVEQVMDARAMIERPHEDRRSHYTSPYAGRGNVAIDGKRVPWNVVHDDLLTYGEARQVEPAEETTGAGWMPR